MDLTQILLSVVSIILILYLFIFIYIIVRLNNRNPNYEKVYRVLDNCVGQIYKKAMIKKPYGLYYYFSKLEEIVIEEPGDITDYRLSNPFNTLKRRTRIIFRDLEGQPHTIRFRHRIVNSDDESKLKIE